LKRSNRLVLLIGVFLAVVAFVGIIIILSGSSGPGGGKASASPTILSTVIAAKDIALGVRITEDMLTKKDLPTSQRKAGAFEIPSQVVGQTARRAITSGAQIEKADFIESVNNFAVPAGMRAIAVQVDMVSGVGTLIKTGDYVDMVVGLTGDKFPVVTLNPQDDSITVVAGLNSTSVKLLLDGIQVLGTIRQAAPTTGNQNNAPAPSAGAAATERPTTLNDETQELVLLGVTAQQAEVIKFAQIDGTISLVLRSSADFVDANGEPIVSLPPGTTGIILKTLVDGGYGVLRPELVEAIIPAQ
jgi:Flp pilus assembly protein CpaB